MRLYTGICENRDDPLKLGRCQVRIVGMHTYDKALLPTKDLPWAYPMQPSTSAAMSGIGHAPVGLVEGTAVVVMFMDDDNQQPIILGSIGGIPQGNGPVDQEQNSPLFKQDGYSVTPNSTTVTDDNGNQVTTPAPTTPENTGLNPASSYQISSDGINLIKQYEGVKLTAYQDSVGIWTIGYGTTRIAGNPVQPGQTITQAQADQLLTDHINSQVVPTIQKVKAPITQSMFDAMCCFTYNNGSGGFNKSSILTDTNAANYTTAANDFLLYNKANGQVLAGLTKRRQAESTLYLKDGTPDISGNVTPPAAQTPVGATGPNGLPSPGTATTTSKQIGFNDPNGKYPLYLNEPDTNKLARHEDIKKTIVYKKELARELGVVTAGGKTWNQSPIPYNSKYPFNHVFMSESGHVMEFDDTEYSERVHIYHKSGTYVETDANGTQVTRIVGDKYEILERNGYLYVKGTADITIDGEMNVKVNNAVNVEISGPTLVNIFNDAAINISGKADISIKEDLNIKAANIKFETPGEFSVKAGTYKETSDLSDYNWGVKYMYQHGDTYSRHDGGVDHACPGDPNRDTADACPAVPAADPTGLATPLDKVVPEAKDFSELVVITRGLEASSVYETPDEGDPTNYTNKQISDGTLAAGELNSGTQTGSASTQPNNVQPSPASCDATNAMTSYTPDLQLSPNFTLGRLTANGTRMPVDQQGLTKQQIVCNLKGLCENVLEKIIAVYPGIQITSGFRRPGDVPESSKTSQHYLGQAADIVIQGLGRQGHYDAIQQIQQLVPYDQLLLEYAGASTVWIHVSFVYSSPRKQNFTMRDHKRVSEFGTFTLIT